MICPRSTMIATFLYLDRIEKEGKLNIKNKEDVKNIVLDIEKNLNKFISNVTQFEKNLVDLPHKDVPQFHIISKHIIGGANFIKDKGYVTSKDSDKTFDVKTKFNVISELESPIIEDSENKRLLIEKMANNMYLDDEETLYLATSKVQNLDIFIKAFIYESLRNVGLENLFNDSELRELNKIVQKISLKETINPYIASGSILLKEFALDFSEGKIDTLSTVLKNSSLGSIFNSVNLDINDFLHDVKHIGNTEYKKYNTNIISQRTQSFTAFKDTFKYNYFTENNEEFVKSIDNAKNLELTFSFKPLSNDIGFFLTKKSKAEGEVLRYAHIVSKKEELDDNLNKMLQKPCIPSEVTIDLSSGTSVELNYDENEVDLLKISSTRTDRPYFYHSNIADGRIAIEVIDESDTAPKGGSATVMREIAKNAKNIVAGTGTGITGTAKSIVSQLANSGTIDNIEELEKRFTELCGVFEIKNSFFRLLYKAMGISRSYGNLFKNCLTDLSAMKQNQSDSSNISKRIEDFTKEILEKIKKEESLVSELDNINYFDAIRGTTRLFGGLTNDKEFYSSNIRNEGKKIFENFVFSLRSDIVKEVAGVQAGMLASLIMSEKSASISITTREGLTGKKETMNFIDLDTYLETNSKIFSKELTDEIYEQNTLAPKLFREYLNKNAEKLFTTQVYILLKNNFDAFVDAFNQTNAVGKANLKILSDASGLSSKDFITYSSKSGSSTKDDAKNLYAEFLRNNGSLSKKTLASLADESVLAFKTSLDIFERCVVNRYLLEKDVQNEEMYVQKFFAPNFLYSMYGENKEIKDIFYTKNSFPVKVDNDTPYIFTMPLVLQKDSWKPFISKPIKYTASLVNTEIKDILDNFTSKGKEQLIKDSIFKKEKPVIVSSRVVSSLINLYDTVAIASQREHKDEKFIILAIVTPRTNNAIDNIDKTFLNDNNIEIIAVDASRVAVEIDKANSKKLQYSVNANYVPVSRGLSLSKSDELIITDNITKKADGIQLLARLMNPSENALNSRIQMFNGGKAFDVSVRFSEQQADIMDFLNNVESKLEYTEDGTILLSDNNKDLEAYALETLKANGIIKAKPTYSGLINKVLHTSNEVYKGFTSGNLADTKTTEIKKFFEVSTAYEKTLNISNDNDNDNDNDIKFV